MTRSPATDRPEDDVACPACGKEPGDSCDGPTSHPSRLVLHVKETEHRKYLPSDTSVTCDCGATLKNDAERSTHFAETGHRDGTIVKETKKA